MPKPHQSRKEAGEINTPTSFLTHSPGTKPNWKAEDKGGKSEKSAFPWGWVRGRKMDGDRMVQYRGIPREISKMNIP